MQRFGDLAPTPSRNWPPRSGAAFVCADLAITAEPRDGRAALLTCLDALRWAKADLYRLVPDGERQIECFIERWSIEWPKDS